MYFSSIRTGCSSAGLSQCNLTADRAVITQPAAHSPFQPVHSAGRCGTNKWVLRPYHAHYRPISARFPARVKVVIGGAPMTLLSHRGDPECKGVPRALPDCSNQASLAEVSQFRTKKNIALSRGRRAHH